MTSSRRRILVRSAIAAAASALTLPGLAASKRDTQREAPREAPADIDVHIELEAVQDRVAIRPGTQTRVWRYRARLLRGASNALEAWPGTFLGPVIRVRRGQHVRIDLINRLPESTIIHWHGLHVPAMMGGHPRDVIAPGARYAYDFIVGNRAGTTGSTLTLMAAPASRSTSVWRACS